MFSAALKGNDFLHIGITTGCLDVGLKSLYSGVNNSVVCSFLSDTKFSDCYGFTNDELNNILLHFGISIEYKNKIQKKYDGYSCFSEKGIVKNLYNPYSLMWFIDSNKSLKKNFQFKNYWINTGSDIILKSILYNNDFSFEKDFLSLLYGNIIIVNIKESINLDETSFKDKSKENLKLIKNTFSKEYIWTVLLYSGYITLADEEEYKKCIEEMDDQMIKLISDEPEENVNEIELKEYNKITIKKYKNSLINRNCKNDMKYVKVPNNEVLSELTILLTSILDSELKLTKDENIDKFIEGLYDKNIDKINKNLNDYLKKFSSYHLFCKNGVQDNCYQVLLMQLFIFWKIEGLTAEENSGNGRYDFGFPNKNEKNIKEYILIEVKVLKKKGKKSNINFDKECENAIKQIEDKNYAQRHIDNGYNSILKYGIAFHKKTCKVLMKLNNEKIKGPS
ncbi:hypothetical protein PIROE2DRAFT_14445 [Piromyces sp. E2]|nr:hypothetical protein PIROE2DRAFT_14445 [Piromyces sp. E2]|eukprot:OUM59922.1 hypothetical protein PIROE2DRAFT_14445 [Piromyces sp. E2]